MKTVIVSYSSSGNNDAFASSIAKELALEQIKITKPKAKAMGGIIFDVMFKRTPKVKPLPDILEKYDMVLFVGPVWLGQVATPFRAYLDYLNTNQIKYGFITICGGADGPNPKLKDELINRVNKEPDVLVELYIADLLPSEPKPTRNDTMSYRLNDDEVKQLTSKVVNKLQDIIK